MKLLEKLLFMFSEHPKIGILIILVPVLLLLDWLDLVKEKFLSINVNNSRDTVFQQTLSALTKYKVKIYDPIKGKIILANHLKHNLKRSNSYTNNIIITFTQAFDGKTEVKVEGPVSFFPFFLLVPGQRKLVVSRDEFIADIQKILSRLG